MAVLKIVLPEPSTIDRKVIEPVDAVDNGEGERSNSPLSSVISGLNPSWPDDSAEAIDAAFVTAVELARSYLLAQIRKEMGLRQAMALVAAKSRREGAILILEESLPVGPVVESDETIWFTVSPHRDGGSAVLMTVPVEYGSFTPRKALPEAWAGLTNDALAEVTGVPDAAFCHNGRFISVSKTLQGALALARLALDA